jgi:two-component system, cell cycle sensor histidine kinase and response regulator CckA
VPRTILVVEDEAPLRKLVTTILTRAGFNVLETDNVKTALEIARRDDVDLDLVVTDVVMPSGDGLALVRQLVVERPDLRCVVMSGHDERDLSSVLEPELDARFIQKPFTPTQFLISVNEILGTPRT